MLKHSLWDSDRYPCSVGNAKAFRPITGRPECFSTQRVYNTSVPSVDVFIKRLLEVQVGRQYI